MTLDSLRHPLSLAGAALATVTGVLLVAVFTASFLGFEGTPYLGVVAYVALPALLVLGLLLIPLGAARARRQRARHAAEPQLPVLDFNSPRVRRAALVVLALSTANVLLLVAASTKAIDVMDSTWFCGSCHSVMDPEATAHARSPHARVRCVECHIGPGASWFVKSKLSGSWQLVSVTLGLYPRPIPTPVHNLRPARDTCEQCHWPTRFVGDRLTVRWRHADDAASTPVASVLLLHVGGTEGSRPRGIHWHVDPGVRVRYQADAKREKIGTVELTAADGTKKTFQTKDPPPAGARWREMDCVDCHNRPTHIYRSPEEEVDGALNDGRLAPSLPFIRREAVQALRTRYPSAAAARAGLRARLEELYGKVEPGQAAARRATLDAAARELGDIWARNVWPDMKIDWGTYPSFLGHDAAPGCFRCHDGDHATASGEVISNDCTLCHTLLAEDEKAPPILKQLAP